jgi:hypothetical protein
VDQPELKVLRVHKDIKELLEHQVQFKVRLEDKVLRVLKVLKDSLADQQERKVHKVHRVPKDKLVHLDFLKER